MGFGNLEGKFIIELFLYSFIKKYLSECESYVFCAIRLAIFLPGCSIINPVSLQGKISTLQITFFCSIVHFLVNVLTSFFFFLINKCIYNYNHSISLKTFFSVATFFFIYISTFLTFKQFPYDLLCPSFTFKPQANQISKTVFMEYMLINNLLTLYATHFFYSGLLCPQIHK